MNVTLGVVMDPIESINVKKDSTYAMLLAAQRRGWTVQYLTQNDLYLQDGRAWGKHHQLWIQDGVPQWYRLGAERDAPLSELDVLLMRKDPPFDMEYVYTTYILERAELEGVLVVNRPRSLRDANEKLFTAWFQECCVATLVTRDSVKLRAFLDQHQDIIVKPLHGMGGASIFRLGVADPNRSVVFETLTERGQRFAMAQRFIPEIASTGDKRILLIDGEPVPYALARMPAIGETRGNLAAGARGVGVELTSRDRWICAQVGDALRRRGLLFVGLDVIGDYLTEINVTSPTCIRELDAQFGTDIAGDLMHAVAARLTAES